MQCVGGQRVAAGFLRDFVQRAPAGEIGDDRARQNCEHWPCGFDRRAFVAADPAHSLDQNAGCKRQQQDRFAEGRHCLDLAVAVVVFVIGWLSGEFDGVIGHHRCADVEQAVEGF